MVAAAVTWHWCKWADMMASQRLWHPEMMVSRQDGIPEMRHPRDEASHPLKHPDCPLMSCVLSEPVNSIPISASFHQ